MTRKASYEITKVFTKSNQRILLKKYERVARSRLYRSIC